MSSAKPREPGGIASRIAAHLATAADATTVADVRIGLGYTAVRLRDRRTGVAFTFRAEAKGGCSVFGGMRPLSNRRASELLPLIESSDPIEAGVGVACANALADGNAEAYVDGDILDHLDLRPADHVGMVGHFGPLVGALKERARSLTVFERTGNSNGGIRPVTEAEEVLPRCQVALITATSIINGTIDDLLILTRGCREVAILGASTPMLPEVFAAANVTLLSGVMVQDSAEVLRVVSEGGGMRQFRSYLRKVSLRIASRPVRESRSAM